MLKNKDITTSAEFVNIEFFDEDFDGCLSIDDIYKRAEKDPYYSGFKRSELWSIMKRSDKFRKLVEYPKQDRKIYTRLQIKNIMDSVQKTLHPTKEDMVVYKFLINFKGSALTASEKTKYPTSKILEFKRALKDIMQHTNIDSQGRPWLKMKDLIGIANDLHEKNIAELMDALYENGLYYRRHTILYRLERIGLLGKVISQDRFQDIIKPVDKQILTMIDTSRTFANIEEVVKYYNSYAQTKVGQYTLLYWMFKLGFYGIVNRYKKCDL